MWWCIMWARYFFSLFLSDDPACLRVCVLCVYKRLYVIFIQIKTCKNSLRMVCRQFFFLSSGSVDEIKKYVRIVSLLKYLRMWWSSVNIKYLLRLHNTPQLFFKWKFWWNAYRVDRKFLPLIYMYTYICILYIFDAILKKKNSVHHSFLHLWLKQILSVMVNAESFHICVFASGCVCLVKPKAKPKN